MNLETESDINPIQNAVIGRRVLLKDYMSLDYDSPEDTIFSKEDCSVYQPTDDVVVY